MVGVCIGLAGEFIYLLFGDTPLHCVYVFGVEVVELKIIESSIACDYMVIQLNFFWTSLPDALGLSLPIQTNTICTTNQNQNLIYRKVLKLFL
jgi:hypothetical protein